jgi:hypothetical protein
LQFARSHRSQFVLSALFVVLVAALTTPHPAVSRADDKVVLGGGSGIVIDGDTFCTLTTIGNDSQTQRTAVVAMIAANAWAALLWTIDPLASTVVRPSSYAKYRLAKMTGAM